MVHTSHESPARPTKAGPKGYFTWAQLAGYFDGDGAVHARIGRFTIQLFVVWIDTDIRQILHVIHFLRSQGILVAGPHTARARTRRVKAYSAVVAESGGLLKVLKCMYSYVSKKSEQVRAAIDYLDNRITGSQLIEIFDEEVTMKRRRSRHTPLPNNHKQIPYTRSEGHELASRRFESKHSYKTRLTANQIVQIKTAVLVEGTPLSRVSGMFGISRSSVWRIAKDQKEAENKGRTK